MTLTCQVCYAELPSFWTPSKLFCDACQKFFRRYYNRQGALTCSTGTDNCLIDKQSRQRCGRCRFRKCVEAGMNAKKKIGKSKRPTISNAAEEDSSPASVISSLGDIQLAEPVSLSPELTLFDGVAVEEMLRNSVRAFPALHELQAAEVPLTKLGRPITSLMDLGALIADRVRTAHEQCWAYAKYFFAAAGLPESQLNFLKPGFVRQIKRMFLALPSHGGRTIFYIDPVFLPIIENVFPELQEILFTGEKLVRALSEWNPCFVTCAIMFALILVNENAMGDAKLTAARCLLLQAFDLYGLQQNGGNSELLWQRRHHLERCLKLDEDAVAASFQAMRSLASRTRAASSIFEEISRQPHCRL